MNAIWQTLIQTPWWVYVALILLIKLGFQAGRLRVAKLRRLVIVPIALTVWTIASLADLFSVNTLMVSTLTVTVIVGMIIGWVQVYRYDLKIDRQKYLIETPGTWSIAVVICLVFISRYYLGYQLAVNPMLAQQPNVELTALVISGLCTGFFMGRMICYLYRFKTLPSVMLDLGNYKK